MKPLPRRYLLVCDPAWIRATDRRPGTEHRQRVCVHYKGVCGHYRGHARRRRNLARTALGRKAREEALRPGAPILLLLAAIRGGSGRRRQTIRHSRDPKPSESLKLVGGKRTAGPHLGEEPRPVLGIVA